MNSLFQRAGRRCREWAFLREERRTGRVEVSQPWNACAVAVIDWILHAQTATPDDGVAQLYDAILADWSPSYPETTGYIIPSLLNAARRGLGHADLLRTAAVRMGKWLAETQMDDGAVQAGHVGLAEKRPSVFNTGQALRGFTALVENGLDTDGRCEGCARKAAAWMIRQQDADGAWRRGASPLTEGPCKTYDVHAAEALERYGRTFDDKASTRAATANAEWVVSLLQPDGWIPQMSFQADDRPVMHTVAYTLQGLLEIGVQMARPDLTSIAEVAARRIMALQDPLSGSLPGRLAKNYTSDASWSSMTGNAQMACIWFRLHALNGDSSFRDAAVRANRFNCSIQDMEHRNPNRRGGLRGNYPSTPGYGYGLYMNWTMKFHLDALMMQMDSDSSERPGA